MAKHLLMKKEAEMTVVKVRYRSREMKLLMQCTSHSSSGRPNRPISRLSILLLKGVLPWLVRLPMQLSPTNFAFQTRQPKRSLPTGLHWAFINLQRSMRMR
ncbi:hypothetical protein OPIT5_03285 [Opitutaceae bacterium TAV5]|nr:hypothetical protein OPIT5_03285 [Opitutaceae bacterium TAV5]